MWIIIDYWNYCIQISLTFLLCQIMVNIRTGSWRQTYHMVCIVMNVDMQNIFKNEEKMFLSINTFFLETHICQYAFTLLHYACQSFIIINLIQFRGWRILTIFIENNWLFFELTVSIKIEIYSIYIITLLCRRNISHIYQQILDFKFIVNILLQLTIYCRGKIKISRDKYRVREK